MTPQRKLDKNVRTAQSAMNLFLSRENAKLTDIKPKPVQICSLGIDIEAFKKVNVTTEI